MGNISKPEEEDIVEANERQQKQKQHKGKVDFHKQKNPSKLKNGPRVKLTNFNIESDLNFLKYYQLYQICFYIKIKGKKHFLPEKLTFQVCTV